MFNPATACPAAQVKAITPPANIHQFTTTTSLSRGAALLGNVAEAKAGRRSSLGGILEFDKPGIDPAAAMWFERGRRQSVVAQLNQRAFAARFEQKLNRRLPGPHTFDAAPREHHFFIWNYFLVDPSDGKAVRSRDTECPAGQGIGLNHLRKPGLHLGRIGKEREHRFGRRTDVDLKANFLAVARVVHFALFRSAASAAIFSRRNRGRQNPSTN